MCRFLLAKSSGLFQPSTLLYPFTKMAKNSKTYEGDRQKDGWGTSWIDSHNMFRVHKSLNPVWKDHSVFKSFNSTNMLSIHARSTSFQKDKGVISFNQPYISSSFSFVFNGLLKKVSLSVPGKIGAEKIWNLFKQIQKNCEPANTLKILRNKLISSSKEIQALNIGLCTNKNIYALCYFTKHPIYYQLHYINTPTIKIISSEPIEGYEFKSVQSGTILSL